MDTLTDPITECLHHRFPVVAEAQKEKSFLLDNQLNVLSRESRSIAPSDECNKKYTVHMYGKLVT